MDLNAIIAAFGSHNWLVLVMIGALYARTLFSNKSRFPWSWAPNWLPLFSGLAGAVITVDASMMKGSTLAASLPLGFLGLVAGGFFDGLLAAIFGAPANAPTWAKFLVGIIDDIEGGGGGGAAKKNSVDPVTAEAAKLSPPASKRLGRGLALASSLLLLAGCASFWGAAAPTLDCASKVSEDAAKDMTVAQIVLDLPAQCGMDAAAVMAILLGTKDAKVQGSGAYAESVRARAMLASPAPVAACGK